MLYMRVESFVQGSDRSTVKEEVAGPDGVGAFSKGPKQEILPHYNPKGVVCFLLNWWTEQPISSVSGNLTRNNTGIFFKRNTSWRTQRKGEGNNTKREKQMGSC